MAKADKLPAGIVRVAIHPSIGIARVGNSHDGSFYGPEVTDPEPHPKGFYRDGTGALKRQAARFRVYGLDADGKPLAELTTGNATIDWTVHLANKKASWYEFQLAQDIPEALSAPVQMLRNITVGDRASLSIDPGPRSIRGPNVEGGPKHTFDTGNFMGTPVYLGEIRTDEEGRLVVLGGRGKSASHTGARAVTFANNDGWYDDVSDGPVTAEVTVDGVRLPVDPAWVVVAPPNYAPMQKSVRTMWDLMRDVANSTPRLKPKDAPRASFERDIRPLFERLAGLQWVNEGFAAYFGWRSPNYLVSPEGLARLNSRDDAEIQSRQIIANQFRRTDRDAWSPVPWPWMYGDAMNIPTPKTSNAFTTLTPLQLSMLDDWAGGDFDSDYDPARKPPRVIEDVPLAEQPDMLDRASLEFCLADAFHPGCEMTWPMRQPTMYMAPFRLRHAADMNADPSYGAAFTPDMVTLPDGPLYGQLPGGVTRWMAVPWQADTASCRSGYPYDPPIYAPHLPTFWPARVPNQVLESAKYDVVMKGKSLDERLKAFATRSDWLAPIMHGGYLDQINSFIGNISQMGIVEMRDGPKGDPAFPATIGVQDVPPQPAAVAAARPTAPATRMELARIDKVRRFPFGLKTLT
ncbi:LodA/GoxA family CTQ-dependent oxidase [Bradyrhizobium sp. 26S5]|uniref:LodA/GoxA family CTQ-dependent oxidase n=1 Tax=Bradyrhizobium sp. 26S5 TaxID=3139729 RepID=UPI0030D03BE6